VAAMSTIEASPLQSWAVRRVGNESDPAKARLPRCGDQALHAAMSCEGSRNLA